jgi:hypothetical protein
MTEFLAWKKTNSRYFGDVIKGAENYQKPWDSSSPDNLVETSYFGFSIPDEKINCEIYHWAHPMYGVCSGGLFMYQGIASDHFEIAYSNWMNYMPMPEAMTDCTYANGISVKMIREFREWEVSYHDDKTNTHLELNLKSIMPPAFRPVGGHFTQALKTSGELILRGKAYQIDGFWTRDRSWGDPRSEEKNDPPPSGWRVAVFSEDLAFHTFSFESPELNPQIGKRYPGYENGNNFLWGYVWKDGELRGLKSTETKTTFGRRGIAPTEIELNMVDEREEEYRLYGQVIACAPYLFWPNLPCFFSLTEWRYKDMIGYGDTQTGVYEQYAAENLIDNRACR